MEYNLELGSRIIDAGVDVLNPVQPDCMDPEPQNISAIRGELR
jgi:hypothetical protein